MRTCRGRKAAILIALVGATTAVPVWARQQRSLTVSPDHILKGAAPTITLTLDRSVKEIKNVTVAGIEVSVPQPDADGKVPVLLPSLRIVGLADLVVIGKDGTPLGMGQLTYVEAEVPTPVEYKSLFFLLLYVALIVLLPVWATIYDIKKSYTERNKVFDKLQSLATGDTAGLLRTMDQGPTGFVGLTRGLIALTLILALSFAVFHLIVFPAEKIPDIAEKLLMLLAGTLTAITGFYFGSKTTGTIATPQTLPNGGPQTAGAPATPPTPPGSGSQTTGALATPQTPPGGGSLTPRTPDTPQALTSGGGPGDS
jgi:hypothetical protein